ncbi:MAG: hypothetical protein ACUVWR_15405 [Anaerolineae bacterium]
MVWLQSAYEGGAITTLIAQYFLNHRLERYEIERQMYQLAEAGYQGVYAHARSGLLLRAFALPRHTVR